jgi:hypothetical protein
VTVQRSRGTFPGKADCYRITAVWQGGAYVDLYWGSDKSGRAPFDVINVWDYRAGKVEEHMSQWGALTRELEEWYESLGETAADRRAELSNYYAHTA